VWNATISSSTQYEYLRNQAVLELVLFCRKEIPNQRVVLLLLLLAFHRPTLALLSDLISRQLDSILHFCS
jgi:hypothetical protein